ncbi:ACP S-malonyltransferase [Thiorhodospira sibirica]|uniref:ACP S-malonyltransferase n=1 Tax=Thiorhodospira sibirica TaxID=154347 RepID=UPI00022C466A|nr:ACP S-malonyltransferase [Thiorhodospira sibirica]
MSFACVFPGQGSQSLGMLSALAERYALVRETFEIASEALSFDLWNLAQQGPEEALHRTENTQPLMLTAGVAVWRVWRLQGGPMPRMMAGHSLGEYTALVCAGALDFATAVTLVAQRGRLMQGAVPSGEGAMAAILGLEDAQVVAVCAQAAKGQVVEAVNFNAPGQVVIAGHAAAVERALELAKKEGAKRSVLLPVSVPSHCQLMQQAAQRLQSTLAMTDLNPPLTPVLHNVDAEARSEAKAIREALVRQLYSPVRWVDTIQTMSRGGVKTVLEMGPGKVLTGMNKRIDKGLLSVCVQDAESLELALASTQGEH